MNDPSLNEHQPDDDALIGDALRSLDEDAALPDSQTVAHVSDQAGRLFEQSSEAVVPPEPGSDLNSDSESKKSKMIAKVLLAVSSLAACIALVIVGGNSTAGGDVTLASILAKTSSADTLQLKVTTDRGEADVWVRFPDQVRMQQSDSRYQIAAGSQLWQIDEQENTVSGRTSPWFRDDETPIDLLALIGIGHQQAEAFKRSKPEGTVQHAGKPCHVFRLTTQLDQQDVLVEAIAGVDSGQLYTIAAWRGGRRNGAPMAELRLVARDVAIDEEKFVVAETLSEDGRIGKVLDSQGIVTLRPMMSQRWTPIARDMLLKPGDWIRSDVRGGNASTLSLTSGYRVTAGPGSLVETSGPRSIHLHRGELKVDGNRAADSDLSIVGPDDQKLTVSAGQSVHYRLSRDRKLIQVTKKPKWLAGFEGTSNDESIGSLVCNIDGRSVPLTVGFHRVKVEIRDQIARTTIEESFVNHTRTALEGVFHFPLPQDASISGFGMWIGGELIEADVVEKQRAREIYEEILRQRRDPALLEWSGGNIFKARVFPIPAQSEKRIRIVYTQVLPMRANRYRYSYGLRSELLRKTPLQELSLDVLVNSALPLKEVTCRTHPVRSQQSRHSAKLDFSAQHYTPDRDFEVACEVDSKQSDVIVVPHQRGDDGYFMVQLTPPSPDGNWQRELLPDGEPLEVLLVCDTSASMDSEKRKQQQQFVSTILSSLGADDRFNVAVADVDCHWLSDEAVGVSGDMREEAMKWLENRISLGWTDLDRMAQSVLDRTNEKTHVIYVGDGVVTAKDADPQAFAVRLERLADRNRRGTFHAVSVGNSFDSTTLKAVASLGGGSLRQIGGQMTPVKTAFELLNELAQPGLRDLKVEFRGLQVAAVYPDRLPNLAAGTQQILIGRYLPTGKDQSGQIVVTGKLGDEEVRYASRIVLDDAEKGNSFIPRLWARAHLDGLLRQGTNDWTKDEIISLSEEFHIITPYTSLLVLETDEDRERFGVKRRYQMRDGERFFADGSDKANYELLRQQMKRAGDWRIGLRRQILSELIGLGREAGIFQQLQQYASNAPMPVSAPVSRSIGNVGGQVSGFLGGGGATGAWRLAGQSNRSIDSVQLREGLGVSDVFGSRAKKLQSRWDVDRKLDNAFQLDGSFDFQMNHPAAMSPFADSAPRRSVSMQVAGEYNWVGDRRQRLIMPLAKLAQATAPLDEMISADSNSRLAVSGFYRGDPYRYVRWMDTLLPAVPKASNKSEPHRPDWPQEAMEIADRLLQPISLEQGGLEIHRHALHQDPQWDRQTSEDERAELYSPDRWLSHSRSTGSDVVVRWCDGQQRGAYSRGFLLGRTRKTMPGDLEYVPGMRSFADQPMYDVYQHYKVEIARPDDDRVVLVLSYPQSNPASELRFVIDTSRNVVLRYEARSDGKRTTSTEYTDFAEIAGCWWPGTITTYDGRQRPTSQTKQTVTLLDDIAFARRYDSELPKEEVQLVSVPLPSVSAAEVATTDGSAQLEHRLALLIRASLIQNWDDALKQLSELEQLSSDKPGLKWVRAAVLVSARKNEEARSVLQGQADEIAENQSDADLHLATYLLDQVGQIADGNERLAMLNRLQPVFGRQPATTGGPRRWLSRQTGVLRELQRTSEFIQQQHQLANSAPWDIAAQTTYASDLSAAGEIEKALQWLRDQYTNDRHAESASGQLRDLYATFLRREGRHEETIEFFQQWIALEPNYRNAYMHYLHALSIANRSDDADAAAQQWLDQTRVNEKLAPAALEKLNAAVDYARGHRYQQYMNWIDPKWLGPLEETAMFFLNHDHHFDVASSIIDHHYFVDSDQSDRVRTKIAQQLIASAEELNPQRLSHYVRWTHQRKEISVQQWEEIAATLRLRWNEADDRLASQQIASALLQIYSTHFADTEHLPFMRARIARAEENELDQQAAALSGELFDELLKRPWQDEHESEALELILNTSASDDPSERLVRQVGALHRFVDTMVRSRYQVDTVRLQDEGHPEKLTRTQLAKKFGEFQRSAQQGVADRLRQWEDSLDDSTWKRWVTVERMYLDLRLNRKLQEIGATCWELLGEKPERQNEEIDAESEKFASQMGGLLEDRLFMVMHYLAARRSAPENLVDRLLAYIAVGEDFGGVVGARWKARKFSLLVALDRPDDLQRNLQKWIREDDAHAQWQLSLGYLLAERGEIDEAIQLLETVERHGQLSPADYRSLADWYLVADRRDPYQRARIAVFQSMQEYQIHNWLRQKIEPWNRSDVRLPTELDEDVLFGFQALLEKSNQPENYLNDLRNFYTSCRDFRVLKMVPDSVVGRTPQQIYPFLQRLSSTVLYEIRKEATADQLLQHLYAVREKVDTPTDARALDLLESLVERQAANVLNQPQPHIKVAVAALRRAFERGWAEGEVRQMAQFLSELGTTSQREIAEERLHQLRQLHRLTPPGSEDRLFVGWYLAHALFHSYGDRAGSLAMIESALDEIASHHAAGWPVHLNEPLGGYIGLLEQSNRFADGEEVLKHHLQKPLNEHQSRWLMRRRNDLYLEALRAGGRVLLGEGEELFLNVEDHLLQQTKTGDDEHRRQLVNQLLKLYRQARDKKIGSYKDRLRDFALQQLPPILHRQTDHYRLIVQQTGQTVRELLGPRDALEFMIASFENYPKRFLYTWKSPWQQHGRKLCQWHSESIGSVNDLEPRLLEIVLNQLRHDLRSRRSGSRYFYHDNYGPRFWKEKAGDFARAAEEALEEQINSGRNVTYVAEYLHGGLNRSRRAIEVMLIAHQKKILNTAQQIKLCDFLHDRRRYAESIPILEPIVEENPDEIHYRTRLITAYGRCDRNQQMRALLAATDQHFRRQGRWTELNIHALANCCLGVRLHAESAKYFDELIPLHQRTQPNRGIGNGTLSHYYGEQSRVYVAMGNTIKAVEAAAAGVIAWGPSYPQRQSSLFWLENALTRSKNLDAYVKHLDKQASQTGQDSPLIRQKVGVAYSKKKQYKKAVEQLQIAIDLQPTDAATHQALIQAYQALQDDDGVVRQTLAQLDVDRHNLELYTDLAKRLKDDEALSERAATTLVEAAPLEAEHHQALAEYRQQQDRWNDAIVHWKQVAKLRSLEPNGLLKLAEAQLHQEDWPAARRTIEKLNKTDWPGRFQNVRRQTETLQKRLP